MQVVSEFSKLTEQVPILGIALILCLFAGKFATRIKIPKVTAFILIGILLGPSFLGFLTQEIIHSLSFINEIALGLILFNIGGEFHKKLLKEIGKTQALYSFSLAIFIFIIVTLLCFLLNFLAGTPLEENLIISPFLGIIATETAPPTTLLVMKEYKSKGKLSLAITIFLAIGTGVAIIGSRVLKVIYSMLGLWSSSKLNIPTEILLFLWSIIGAIIFGVFLGFALSFFEKRETKQGEILLAVVCTILFGQSLSYYLKTDPLIISLVIGFTLVNASPAGQKIHLTIKEMGLSLYAIFFVLAGSHIHFQVQLKSVGFIGLAYIIARTGGILLSGSIAGKIFKVDKRIRPYTGLSLLSHAGAALAIVAHLRPLQEQTAQTIVTVITSSIFVFEILGPLTLKHALVKTGEIDKTTLDRKSSKTTKIAMTLKEQWHNFLLNLGIYQDEKKCENITHIHEIMSTDLLAIHHTSNIQTVLNFINEHAQECYPIIDEDGLYVGLIDMDALHQVINDDSQLLIMASSLIRSRDCLDENVSYEEAKNKFKETRLDYLPVINIKNKKLLGVISLKKLVLAYKKA